MKTYTIKEVSELFNIPNSTIRYYEEIGILTKVERNSVGKRIFLESHINRLKAISCFKNTGMSLEKIKQFFDFEDELLQLMIESAEEQICFAIKDGSKPEDFADYPKFKMAVLKQVKEEYDHRGLSADTMRYPLANGVLNIIHQLRLILPTEEGI